MGHKYKYICLRGIGTELFRLAAAAFVTLLHIIRHEYYTSRTNCRKVSQIGEMSIEFYTPIHIQGGPKKAGPQALLITIIPSDFNRLKKFYWNIP